MASKLGGNDDEPISEINIVPFVDIILVVLIIFMVTTPLIMKPSINVQLPKAASGSETAPSQLLISLTSEGALSLNGKASSIEGIKAYAQDIIIKNPKIQAIISADKSASHGDVVSVIDAIKTSGINKFAITIDKK